MALSPHLSRELKTGIKEIPGEDGYWKANTEIAFVDAGRKLLNLGMNEEEVLDFLTTIYSAVSEEFGGQ